MELTYYNQIKEYINKQLPNQFKTIRLFNNQFKRMSTENSFAYPALFIQFMPVDVAYKNLEGVQHMLYNIVFHIAVESYLDEDTRIYEMKEKLFGEIQYFQTDFSTRLERINEQPDFDHNSYQVYRITCKSQFEDNQGIQKIKKEVTINPDFTIIIDKQI